MSAGTGAAPTANTRAAGRLHRRPAASPQRTEYQGRSFAHRTIERQPREDEMHTLSASVHNRAFALPGFSLCLSLVREERDTNAQALDHDRNRADLSFVRHL